MKTRNVLLGLMIVVPLCILATQHDPTPTQRVEAITLHEAQTEGYSFPTATSVQCIQAKNSTTTWNCMVFHGSYGVASAQSTTSGAVFAPVGYKF